ncbi:MAG: putative thiamine transporter thiamine-binding protein [Acidimicrobiales bacterium]|nr:putative thiamine transporter thiamine-binding protein [Acidimicrobiales bacterium]
MKRVIAAALAASLLTTACGSDKPSSASTNPTGTTGTSGSSGSTAVPDADAGTTLTIVAYDSFAVDPKTFESFTASTGIKVEVVTAGDAGAMLSKAALTAGNPEGDVMWGVDNTLLARALDSKVFQPYASPELSNLAPDATALVPGHEATPVDEGDVCINFDIAWFAAHQLDVPTTLDQLTDPKYKDLLVVENPATSSTGLAFLLATVAKFGQDGWQQYWKDLRANGVKVVDGWDQAYDEQFSGSSGKGPRPLVVSYGSSPPFEVIYADPKPAAAPTGVMGASCFHQVEFAGVLRGTDHPAAAGKLIDFLVSKEFQDTMPLTLYVYPVRDDASVPAEFTEYAVRPTGLPTVSPADIEAHAKDWINAWTDITVR